MTRLATTITIPVASAAKQENSTRSLTRKGILNASPSPPCALHILTLHGLDLRSMPDSGAIKNYYACFPQSATVVVTLTGLTIRHRDPISPLAAWNRGRKPNRGKSYFFCTAAAPGRAQFYCFYDYPPRQNGQK